MAERKKQLGRPQLDPDQRRGERLAFRPKKSVRDYLDQQVRTGESISIGTAINEAIDRLQQNDESSQNELVQLFGGKHTLGFALLFAASAKQAEQQTGQEWIYHKRTAEHLYFLFSEILLNAIPDKLDTKRKESKSNRLLSAIYDRVPGKLISDAASIIKSGLLNQSYLPWRTALPHDQEVGRKSTLVPELQIAKFIAQHLINIKPQKSLHSNLDVFLFDIRQQLRELSIDYERRLFDLQETLESKGIEIDNLKYAEVRDLLSGKKKLEDISAGPTERNSFEPGEGNNVITLKMAGWRTRKRA